MKAGMFLTFQTGGVVCAAQVEAVKEIIPLPPVTRVPRVSPVILGVMNLRGNVVPVLDLALRLDLQGTSPTPRSCVLVIGEDEEIEMGLLVSSVSVVLDITSEEIEPVPDFGTGIRKSLLQGIAKAGGELIPVLDLRKIADEQELSSLVQDKT